MMLDSNIPYLVLWVLSFGSFLIAKGSSINNGFDTPTDQNADRNGGSCSYAETSTAWLASSNFATCTDLDLETLQSIQWENLQTLFACLADDETSMAQCQQTLGELSAANTHLSDYLKAAQSHPFEFCQCFDTFAQALPDCGGSGPLKMVAGALSSSCLYLFKGCDYTSLYESCFYGTENQDDQTFDAFCSEVESTCSDFVLAPMKCQSEVDAGLWGQMQKYATNCLDEVQSEFENEDTISLNTDAMTPGKAMEAVAALFGEEGGEAIGTMGDEGGTDTASFDPFSALIDAFWQEQSAEEEGEDGSSDTSLIPKEFFSALAGNNFFEPPSDQDQMPRSPNQSPGSLPTGAADQVSATTSKESIPPECVPWLHQQQGGAGHMMGGQYGQHPPPPMGQGPPGQPQGGSESGSMMGEQNGQLPPPPMGQGQGPPGQPPGGSGSGSMMGGQNGQLPPPPMGQGQGPPGQPPGGSGSGSMMGGQNGQLPPPPMGQGEGPPGQSAPGSGSGTPWIGGQNGLPPHATGQESSEEGQNDQPPPPPMMGQGEGSPSGMQQNGQEFGMMGQRPPSYCQQYMQDRQFSGADSSLHVGGWIFLTLIAISVVGVGSAFFIARRWKASRAANQMRNSGYMRTITEEPDDMEMSPMTVGTSSLS